MTDDYKVEGYGVKTPEYDGPYLKGADFDPKVKFANAGDVKAAAKDAKEELKVSKKEPETDPTAPALDPVKTKSEAVETKAPAAKKIVASDTSKKD